MEKNIICTLKGKVVKGKGAGHKFGMPTANIDYGNQQLPKLGVYGGKALFEDKEYTCITNVGLRPSDDNSPIITVESMLLDFDGDLYDKDLKVNLYFYLRDIKKFSNGLQGVKDQLVLDAKKTKELFGEE